MTQIILAVDVEVVEGGEIYSVNNLTRSHRSLKCFLNEERTGFANQGSKGLLYKTTLRNFASDKDSLTQYKAKRIFTDDILTDRLFSQELS